MELSCDRRYYIVLNSFISNFQLWTTFTNEFPVLNSVFSITARLQNTVPRFPSSLRRSSVRKECFGFCGRSEVLCVRDYDAGQRGRRRTNGGGSSSENHWRIFRKRDFLPPHFLYPIKYYVTPAQLWAFFVPTQKRHA